MGKLSLDGSYGAVVRQFSTIDKIREQSVSFAAHGEYAAAFAKFRKSIAAAPYIPRGWAPHIDILQLITTAIEDHYSRWFQALMQSHYLAMRQLALQQHRVDEYEDHLNAELENHIRDMEYAVNTSAKIAGMLSRTDRMIAAEYTNDARLKEIEVLFTEAPII